MSDRFFVGLDITGFENTGKYRPISRITLMLDDVNVVTAGDDNGLEISASCPFATQEMANALLAQMKGYQYQSYTADSANIDPSAELGDGISVGGIYSVLSKIEDDGNGFPDISSPGEVAIEEEYPSSGPMTQEFNRKISETRSTITKTAEEIRLEVERELDGLSSSFTVKLDAITARVNGLDGKYTELAVTIDGVTVTDASGTTLIKGSSIQTSTLYVDAAHVTGMLEANQINLRGSITFSDLSNSVQDDINDAYTMAKDAQREVTDVSDTVSGWTYRGTTYIDGAMLMTGTVMASHLIGGDITLLTDREATAGFMSITGSSSSSFAVDMTSYGALRLTAETGNVYIEGGSGSYLQLSSATVVGDSDLVPNRNARNSCGTAGQMWSEVYAASSEIVTSDRNEKHSIDYDLSKYESLFDGLKPCSYQYNNGRSGRTHTGMIAQDVEALLAETGIGALGFAGFVKSETEAGDTVYALRYEEFVALCVDQIQKLKARVAELEKNHD